MPSASSASVSPRDRARRSKIHRKPERSAEIFDWITLKALRKKSRGPLPLALGTREASAVISVTCRYSPARPRSPTGSGSSFEETGWAVGIAATLVVVSLLGLLGWRIERHIEAGRLLEDARGRLDRFEALGEERVSLATATAERDTREMQAEDRWRPPGDRREELELESRRRQVESEMQAEFTAARSSLDLALRTVPGESSRHGDILATLEKLMFLYFKQADQEEQVRLDPEFFADQIRALELGTYREELARRGRIELEISPAGAEVHIFRFEEHEFRLLPLPFRLSGRTAGTVDPLHDKPVLRIEKIEERDPPVASPFRVGDTLVSVGDQQISTRGDLANSLRTAKEGDRVTVTLKRDGEDLEVEWTPFSPGTIWVEDEDEDEDGNQLTRLIDIRDQLGLTFVGYPLDFPDTSRLPPPNESGLIELDLPPGSYLLIARKKGHLEARCPSGSLATAGPRTAPPTARQDRGRSTRLRSHSRRQLRGRRRSDRLPRPPLGPPGNREGLPHPAPRGHLREYLEFINDPEISSIIKRLSPNNLPTDPGDLKADWSARDLAPLVAPDKEGRDTRVFLVPFRGYSQWHSSTTRRPEHGLTIRRRKVLSIPVPRSGESP